MAILRWIVLFVAAYLCLKLVPGMVIAEYWSLQACTFSLLVSACNAIIAFLTRSWFFIIILSLIVNGAIAILLGKGYASFNGITANGYSAAFTYALCLFVVSCLCNRYLSSGK